MAKTADVLQAIWADPWFLSLAPDGKLIFLWGITNEHANLAGVYVVAEETIRHETKFSQGRLAKALELVHPKLGYRPETGTVVVPSRPKYVRSKTEQIAKSIVRAVEDCLHDEIKAYYLRKYGQHAWLGKYFADSALLAGISEPQPTSVNLSEVHSQSQSSKEQQKTTQDSQWSEWLEHFQATTGRRSTGSATARRHFSARLAEGKTLDELKLATVGCNSDEHLRQRGFNRPETILQESKVERYIGLAEDAGKPKRDVGLERLIGRAA